MNRDDVLAFLATLFETFWIHPLLVSDLASHISGSGVERKFFTLLMARLKFLREHGPNAIRHEEFETLTGAQGIYSMHMASKGFNIRILYAFSPQKTPILLAGFYERAGKRKANYAQYIPIAQQRLSEEMEAYKHEQ